MKKIFRIVRRAVKKLFRVLSTSCLLSLIMAMTGSCAGDRQLEAALEYAGDNAGELRKVLGHYEWDSRKLESARSIIRNLHYKYGYEPDADLDSIERMLGMVATTENLWYFKDISRRDWSRFSYSSLPKVYDCRVISAKEIIDNIERAYAQREARKWNRNLSDADFNDFLLPHRIGDERLSDWRSLYLARYGAVLDSLYPGGDDVLRAAEIIFNTFQEEGFKYNACSQWPHRTAADLFRTPRAGGCRDACDVQLYALRSVGIPCAIDTYFACLSSTTSHQWVVVLDNVTGRFIPLSGHMTRDGVRHGDEWRKMAKVYRFMPGVQQDRVEHVSGNLKLPSPIRSAFLKDVTSEYYPADTLTFEIDNPEGRQVTLGVFHAGEWMAIDYAAESDRKRAVFHNVEPGGLYVPLVHDEKSGRQVACGQPVEFGKDRSVRPLYPARRRERVTLEMKMPFMPWLYDWFSRGVAGGYLETSADAGFRNAERGATFPDTLERNMHLTWFSPRKSRYVRLTVPGRDEILIGELEIYADSACRKPIPYKAVTRFGDTYHPENMNDGDPVTFFAVPLSMRSIVLDTGSLQEIEAIKFVPRNNDNFVWPYHKYQLMYFDSPEKGWQVADTKVSDGHTIEMEAPQGALLWLRDLTKGHEEEIFLYCDGHQVFAHSM